MSMFINMWQCRSRRDQAGAWMYNTVREEAGYRRHSTILDLESAMFSHISELWFAMWHYFSFSFIHLTWLTYPYSIRSRGRTGNHIWQLHELRNLGHHDYYTVRFQTYITCVTLQTLHYTELYGESQKTAIGIDALVYAPYLCSRILIQAKYRNYVSHNQ